MGYFSTSPCRRVTILGPRRTGRASVREQKTRAPQTRVLGSLKLGIALYAAGRPLAAAVPLRRVTQAAPENAAGHYLLGLVYKALGRDEAAAAEWHIAATLPQTDHCDDWVRGMARKLLAKHCAAKHGAAKHGVWEKDGLKC